MTRKMPIQELTAEDHQIIATGEAPKVNPKSELGQRLANDPELARLRAAAYASFSKARK